MRRGRKSLLMTTMLLATLSLAACDSPEEKQAKYLDRGNQLFEKGEYDKARLEYKNAARIKPSDAQVRYRLGLVDEAQGNIRDAFRNFAAAEQQDANYEPALKKLVQYFLAGEAYDEAQKRMDVLLARTPNDAETRALNAALLLRQKKLDEAEKEGAKALEIDPSSVTGTTVLSGIYVARENLSKAAEVIETGITRNPKSLALLLLKAVIYEKQNNIEKIAEAYQAIFALKPEQAKFRNDLAKVYVQADKKDQAEKILRDGVAAAPGNWDMKQALVLFLSDNSGLDQAEAEIKSFMAANPDREELYFWLAEVYLKHQAADRAIALLESIVQKQDSGKEMDGGLNARMSLARIHFVKGNKQLAEKLAQIVLEKEPNNREALFIKAQMLFDEGQDEAAITALRTIVRDNPKATDALQLLSEGLLRQGFLDLAIDTLEQLVDVAPSNTRATVRLAQLLSARGEHDRAMLLLELVTKVQPDYAIGWESTARVAIAAKQEEKANIAIAKLESMAGQEATALFLKGQLAQSKSDDNAASGFYRQVIEKDQTAPIVQHALKALAEIAVKANTVGDFVSYLSTLPNQTAQISSVIGDYYMHEKKNDLAAQAYDRALASSPPVPANAYIARARLFVQAKDLEKALALLSQAEEQFPSDPRAAIMQADLLSASGKVDEALAVYDKVLARMPGNDIAANNMAQLIADEKSSDEAALEKARVVAERFIRSTNPYYLDTLAWVYFRQGKTDQAQTIYERIFQTDKPLPPPIHFHYATLLAKMGRAAEAKGVLEKALSSGKEFPERAKAEALLKAL